MRIMAYTAAHDSSVCVINDGDVEYFCKEERLSREKRDGAPFLAVQKYKEKFNGKIDHVLFCTPTNLPGAGYNFVNYIRKNFGVEQENYSALKHHICHASLAFYNSGFDECLVFTIDRNGSLFFINEKPVCRESESVFVCSGNNTIKPVYKSFWVMNGHEWDLYRIKTQLREYYGDVDLEVDSPYSIVKVYEAATTLIKQNVLENGKTMGLSSYGRNKEYDPLFIKNRPIPNHFVQMFDLDNEHGAVHFSDSLHLIEKNITPENFQYYADKAKQVQVQTQEVVCNLIEKYVKLTGIKNVCLVGGYGLNVVANGFYIKKLPNVKFYFEPIADDAGISVGASMLKYSELTGEKPLSIKNNFFHFYDFEEKINEGEQSSLEEICNLLISGKSVAIFEGQPESGPRALGHRSILFDPRNKNGKNLVNKIKKREWYRPFAGTILKEKFEEYFESHGLTESPYMTINFSCKEKTIDFVPAIVHVDNTCRIQTVEDGFFYELLEMFYEKTGCPMLLNTSFNLAGEPLVQTKKEALKTFNNTTLDAIYFVDENKIVKKND